MKQKWVDAYMDVAERFARLSSAKRLQCGAIVVKDNRVISIGYNGTPEGWDNECEERIYITNEEKQNSYEWIVDNYPHSDSGTSRPYKLITRPEVMHAEENALTKLAKSHESAEGATMFITHAPCFQCAKLIYASGIKKVFYKHKYRLDEGIVFLEKCNVDIQQHNSE